MNCQEVEVLMTEAILGTLENLQKRALNAHLKSHEACARLYQELLGLVQGLHQSHAHFELQVDDLLDRVYGLGRHQRKVWLGAGLRWGVGLATAGLVLVLGLGFLRPEFSDEELAAWAMDEAGFSLVGDQEDMWEDF